MSRALFATVIFASLVAKAEQNVEIKIEGMACESCQKSVTNKLMQVPNIKTAKVRVVLKENKALLKVKNANSETIEAIKKAIADAGYKVVGKPKVF